MTPKLGQIWSANKQGLLSRHPGLIVITGIFSTELGHIEVTDLLTTKPERPPMLREEFLELYEFVDEPESVVIDALKVYNNIYIRVSEERLEVFRHDI